MSDKLLRRRALLAKLGFSSSTLHRKIKAGELMAANYIILCRRLLTTQGSMMTLWSHDPVLLFEGTGQKGWRCNYSTQLIGLKQAVALSICH